MIDDGNQRIEIGDDTLKCVHRRVRARVKSERTSYPSYSLPFTSKFEDRCFVAESLLAQLFHQLDGNQRDAVLAGVLFNAFFHHGAQEVGNAA